MELKPEMFAALGSAITMYSFLMSRKAAAQKSFRCTRCATTAAHTERTMKALREGKSPLLCRSCDSC